MGRQDIYCKKRIWRFPGLDDSCCYSSVGGAGAIAFYDEGSFLGTYQNVNFVGADIYANAVEGSSISSSLTTQVLNVYVPPPEFVSNFNTSNGTNDCTLSSISTTTRRISSPDSEGNPFKIGDWSGDEEHEATRTDSVYYSTANQCSFNDLTTTIEVNIYDADGVAKLATHTTSSITGDYTDTVDNITIIVSSFEAEQSKYKGIISVDFNLNTIFSDTSGRFSVEIIHHDASDYTKTDNDLFYDSETFSQDISGVSIAEQSLLSTKYLSGIRYYDEGDQFLIGISDLDYLNAETYPTNFVQVSSNGEYGIGNFNLSGADLDNWTHNYSTVDSSYSAIKSITRDDFRYIGEAANISAQVVDWSAATSSNSGDASILIDTWDQQSDELSEYFTDEIFRSTSSLTAWESSSSLVTYEGGLGLMVQGGTLKTARGDWTNYSPSGNPDYTSFVGTGNYTRKFIDLASEVRGSASLSISGFTLEDLVSTKIKMYIDVPGRFTDECFVHGSALYDFGTFNGDNDPLRKDNSTTNQIEISFGNLGLTSTYKEFVMRLEFSATDVEPDSIVVSW